MPRKPFDDEERPTQPDLATIPCPACVDPQTGKPSGRERCVEHSAAGRYRSRLSDTPNSCPLCEGACYVTSAQFKHYQSQP
jgi:hypothetical protein